MNKEGKVVLKQKYFSIEPADSFWIISNGREKSVMNAELETVLPFIKAKLWISDGIIQATMGDHTIRTYNLSGEIIEGFHISDISQLCYDTNEIHYNSTKNYDEEGHLSSETENREVSTGTGVAHCRRYQAEYNWYGLITQDGHVVTPPSYSDITAIGPDLYLCKTDYEHGVILNGKGQRVK